jgi:hypothetical protein
VTTLADATYGQLAADAGCAFQPVPADLRQIVTASAAGQRRAAEPGRLVEQCGRERGACAAGMPRSVAIRILAHPNSCVSQHTAPDRQISRRPGISSR